MSRRGVTGLALAFAVSALGVSLVTTGVGTGPRQPRTASSATSTTTGPVSTPLTQPWLRCGAAKVDPVWWVHHHCWEIQHAP